MFSERAGYYSLSFSDDCLESFYTFTPHPLCRDIALRVDDEILSLLANAHRQLGLLEGSCRNINDIEHINRLFLIKETTASYSIDDNLLFIYPELFGYLEIKDVSNAYHQF